MKKLFFIAFVALIFSACTTREYYDVTEIVEPMTFTQTYRVTRNMWQPSTVGAPGLYYFCEIRERNLTNEIFDFGVMQAFLYYEMEGRDTMSPLPFSDFVVDRDGYRWEEQLTVEFQPGFITFILKIDDHASLDEFSELPFWQHYDFRVRFLW